VTRDNGTITVAAVEGYQYALDNDNDDAFAEADEETIVFDNLSNDWHTLYVKNKLGCVSSVDIEINCGCTAVPRVMITSVKKK
jgi:hypothetical protein